MLRPLELCELNKVLAANFSTWSPGLDRQRYTHYQWWQLTSPWGRRNIIYFGYFSPQGDLLASCKRYKLEFCSRGKEISVAGIGAVFVESSLRGQAHGQKMLEQMIELCLDEGFDALMLNSDIDPAYYEKLGFNAFDYSSFLIPVQGNEDTIAGYLKDLSRTCGAEPGPEAEEPRQPEAEDLALMLMHHGRWRSHLEYAIGRSPEYLQYKIGKERYLYQHSKLNWPKMEIIGENFGKSQGAYALIEQSGPYLRVLEVVGSETARNLIWQRIFKLALKRQALRIRGWSLAAPELTQLSMEKRNWSIPMMLALKQEHEARILYWSEMPNATFLELDHF